MPTIALNLTGVSTDVRQSMFVLFSQLPGVTRVRMNVTEIDAADFVVYTRDPSTVENVKAAADTFSNIEIIDDPDSSEDT